jgi:hypothetical protein
MNEHSPDRTDDLTDRLRRTAGTDAPALSPELVAGASGRRAPRLIDHGRTARVASASLAAVAAVAVGSLVVANPFAPRAPLFTAAAGAPASGESASAMAEDARIALWIDYDYVAGPGLSTEGGRGGVYQLQRVGTADGLLADLAERFGVEGTVAETSYFDPAWPSYIVGPEDGTAPSVSVTWSGTGNWWYSNPSAYPDPVCELVEYETENGLETFEECIQPEIPAEESLAPSAAEAKQLAAELFAGLGLDIDAADVRVMADAWQTMASASLTVGGVATAIEYSVGWTPLGEIAWASGHAIEVVERGTFDTVSAAAAVERLEDWRWFGAGGPEYQGGMNILAAESGVARDAGVGVGAPDSSVSSPVEEPGTTEPTDPTQPTEPTAPTEPGEPSEEPSVDPTEPSEEPSVDPTIEPAPLPEPSPETVTVTVETAEPTLLLMWDADGNAWLVPGYAMQHPDGFWNTIVSLIEGIIELPAPIEGEVVPFLED